MAVASTWLTAVVLLVVDSADGRGGILSAWAILCALGATAWTCALLHAHSRRVVLEVMSFEHRQQTPAMVDSPSILFEPRV